MPSVQPTAPLRSLRARRAGSSPSRFGSSLAVSLGVHATALGAGLLVTFGAAPGLRGEGPAALVMLAEADQEPVWQTQATPAPESEAELELPAEPTVELVPVEVPLEDSEQAFAPDSSLEPLPVDEFAFTSSSALPLRRVEPRPAPIEESHAVAASAPAAAAAPRGEDRPLRLLEAPSPEDPLIALRLQQEGSVLIEIQVTADGRVSSVRVLESCGFERLDEAACEGVLAWRFEPALEDGVRVPERFLHRIEFRLN